MQFLEKLKPLGFSSCAGPFGASFPLSRLSKTKPTLHAGSRLSGDGFFPAISHMISGILEVFGESAILGTCSRVARIAAGDRDGA